MPRANCPVDALDIENGSHPLVTMDWGPATRRLEPADAQVVATADYLNRLQERITNLGHEMAQIFPDPSRIRMQEDTGPVRLDWNSRQGSLDRDTRRNSHVRRRLDSP